MKQATLISLKEFRRDPRNEMDPRTREAANYNGFPVVGSHVRRRDHVGLLAGAALALVLGGGTFWMMSSHRQVPAPVVAAPKPAIPAHVAPPVVKPAPRPVAAPAPKPDDMKGRVNAPALIVDTSVSPAPAQAQASQTASATAAKSAKPSLGPLSPDEAFAERIGNGGVDVATATVMTDPANTVVQGVLIPAVLETAINSDLPGYARAIVSQDVRSFDGSKVLIPRASHLIGQYKSGVADGQRRAYILWSRLITPDGVSIALGSPTTDFSGKTGVAGDVDTHFFARFGSALLLSVVDLFSAIGHAGVVISGGGTSAASVVAQKDSQIPPTITVPQGTPIRVFTAKDLDFSTVDNSEIAKK